MEDPCVVNGYVEIMKAKTKSIYDCYWICQTSEHIWLKRGGTEGCLVGPLTLNNIPKKPYTGDITFGAERDTSVWVNFLAGGGCWH